MLAPPEYRGKTPAPPPAGRHFPFLHKKNLLFYSPIGVLDMKALSNGADSLPPGDGRSVFITDDLSSSIETRIKIDILLKRLFFAAPLFEE